MKHSTLFYTIVNHGTKILRTIDKQFFCW